MTSPTAVYANSTQSRDELVTRAIQEVEASRKHIVLLERRLETAKEQLSEEKRKSKLLEDKSSAHEKQIELLREQIKDLQEQIKISQENLKLLRADLQRVRAERDGARSLTLKIGVAALAVGCLFGFLLSK